MLKVDRNYCVVFVVFAALCLFPLAMPSSSHIDTRMDPRFQEIPFAIGDWIGKDQAVDEMTYAILETRNVLSRSYVNSQGERIELLVVSSDKDRRVAHPPEVCY